jgi:hypothetical protein
MRHTLVIRVMGVLLCCGGLAQADPITIQITGNVTSAGGSALPSMIHVGDIFTGTYTYDSSAINTSTQSNIGTYVFNSPCGISLSLDGLEFKTDPTQMSGGFGIDIYDDLVSNGTHDYYYVHGDRTVYTNGLWIDTIWWKLGDSTHTAISSVALPITAPILSAWNYNYVQIAGGDGGVGHVDFYIDGTVTQATLVPEPFTCALMAMGVFLLQRKR